MSTTPQPQTPSPWPDKPLIRIVSGYGTGVGLVNSQLALRDAAGSYRLEGGGLLVPNTGDVIETWEEMTAVPVYQASEITAGAVYGGHDRARPSARPSAHRAESPS